MSAELDDLLEYCKSNKRICPMPDQWNKLWEMLPNRSRIGTAWEPALPLILAAWTNSSGLSKILRLEEHLQWATENGALSAVEIFLRGLPEEHWAHLDE